MMSNPPRTAASVGDERRPLSHQAAECNCAAQTAHTRGPGRPTVGPGRAQGTGGASTRPQRPPNSFCGVTRTPAQPPDKEEEAKTFMLMMRLMLLMPLTLRCHDRLSPCCGAYDAADCHATLLTFFG